MKISVFILLGVVFGSALAYFRSRNSNKKISSLSATKSASFADLAPAYAWTERDTGFFGKWRETNSQNVRIAVQERNHQLFLYVGNFDPNCEQITDIYLEQISQRTPLPKEGSPQRLDGFLGPDGVELARRYFLLATGAREYPALTKSSVRNALLRLSSAIHEVMIFEEKGVQLVMDLGETNPDRFTHDLDAAITLVKSL